jgi:glycosyltransferase involved in cell wall biosynthesis
VSTAPLRVLYVSPHATLGGAERVTLDLVSLHDRAAVEPSICFLRDGPLVAHCRERLGVPTHLVVAPGLRHVFAARTAVRRIAEIVTNTGMDLVHSSMAWGHVYGGRAAASARRPAVWFQHVGGTWASPIEAIAAFVKTRAIIANSEFTAVGQRRVNPRGAPIHVIHPGTVIPKARFAERRAAAREALGIAEGEFAVGIAARLQPWKGQDVVLRAAASLLHARAHARLFVIGDALFGLDQEYAASLPVLARQLGIEPRVTMTGFRADVPEVLAGLDLAIHASTSPEPFGLGLIEAMAAGVALVAADAGATREIVTPGLDGMLTPPGDHEALATAMLALCDDPERRERLAREGEATARDRFDARQMVRAAEQLYRTLVPR